ncbi:hypothetical protein J2X87_000511 [Pseudomonas synxantha]|uniref:Uncharacterized protein n=1 Tax=Pseudomonas synxantha TaxID=47883 RepID=A0ACC6JGN8_9PSED|nr:hypothetical protein [Pseudomonas synxantha]
MTAPVPCGSGLAREEALPHTDKTWLIPISHKHHTLRDMAWERLPV